MGRSARPPPRPDQSPAVCSAEREIDVDAFVRVDNLCKRYGGLAAVDGVSFEVGQGQTLALLGPSGCGKTTILRSIAGLESPDEGSIAIGGRTGFDAAARIDIPPHHRELGILFQSHAICPPLSSP